MFSDFKALLIHLHLEAILTYFVLFNLFLHFLAETLYIQLFSKELNIFSISKFVVFLVISHRSCPDRCFTASDIDVSQYKHEFLWQVSRLPLGSTDA